MNNLDRFFTLEEINPNLKILEENFDTIRQEFLENFKKLYWINWGYENGYNANKSIVYSEWKIAPIYLKPYSRDNISDEGWKFLLSNLSPSVKNPKISIIDYEKRMIFCKKNYFRLPLLSKLLLESGITKRVGISMLNPEKEIPWHVDPDPESDNRSIIRGLWGLDIQEEKKKECYIMLGNEVSSAEKRIFSNNQHMFFWGGVRHMVKNNLSTPRYCICFDQEIDSDYLRNL